VKTGGQYNSVKGIIKKIDAYEGLVLMEDGTRIEIEEILNIKSEIFQTLDDFYI
jgi:hypothetical protein